MQRLKEEGYTIKSVCNALGLSRSNYYRDLKAKAVKIRRPEPSDEELLGEIKEIKLNHPFWGYRRVTAWLRHRGGIVVNRKKVYQVMKGHGLMANQKAYRAKRTSKRSKPRADRPRQYWGIDMTKFILPMTGWVYLVIVLDWYTKKIVG